jgi:hypothetical protein
MTLPAREPPRWLPLAVLLPLVALLDPCWLDFEAARRAQLLVVVGAAVLLAPRWFMHGPRGDRWLSALICWLSAALLFRSGFSGPDATVRLAHAWALILLLRLGHRTGGDPWRRTAAPLLLLAATAGILQRFGVMSALGTPEQPVSLFGNLNVAAEFVAIAAAAVAVGFASQRRLGALALLLGGAYAVLNGSRSALVALPAALLFAAACDRGRPLRDRLGPLTCVLVGGALGALLPASPAAANPAANVTRPAAAPPTSLAAATIEVRLEIARSGLSMLVEAPLFGHGCGQFAVQYPRFRSQREIELSSFGRAEMRRVGTAHDDWLEVAIEGGVPALLLLLGFVIARWRAVTDRICLTPLVALGLLMLVRAPLGNAPAVALALLASANAGPSLVATADGAVRRVALRIVGLALLALGVAVLTAVTLLGRAVAAAPAGPEPAAVERALAPWPYDPTAWQLLASVRRQRASNAGDALAALDAADHAVALRPHEPSYRLLRADLLRLSHRFPEAKRELAEVARLDPGEPQVNVQLAGVFFTEHDVDGTVAALCTDPPPVLRRSLAVRFDEFATLATQQGDAAAARRFLAEASCVRALDATGAIDARGRAVSGERFATMRLAFEQAGLHDGDMREYVVLALRALDAGDPGAAALAANAAARRERKMPAWQWSLLAPFAERLRAVTEWRALLPD